jgi:hypothetical protein
VQWTAAAGGYNDGAVPAACGREPEVAHAQLQEQPSLVWRSSPARMSLWGNIESTC